MKQIHKTLSVISFLIVLMMQSFSFAQDASIAPGERTVVVGQTTVTYILPSPPDLQLTPPAILQNPPSDARIYPMLARELAPYNGVLFNGSANAWLEAERNAIPGYLSAYENAIKAQMVAWAYMHMEQFQLSLATEREENRLRVANFEREIHITRHLRRRSILRPVLLTGFSALLIGAATTTTAYIVGRNH